MAISQEQLFKKLSKLELWLEHIADSLEDNNELIEDLLEAISENYEDDETDIEAESSKPGDSGSSDDEASK